MSQENYTFLTPRLLRSFDRAISLVKPVLVARYGEEAETLTGKRSIMNSTISSVRSIIFFASKVRLRWFLTFVPSTRSPAS